MDCGVRITTITTANSDGRYRWDHHQSDKTLIANHNPTKFPRCHAQNSGWHSRAAVYRKLTFSSADAGFVLLVVLLLLVWTGHLGLSNQVTRNGPGIMRKSVINDDGHRWYVNIRGLKKRVRWGSRCGTCCEQDRCCEQRCRLRNELSATCNGSCTIHSLFDLNLEDIKVKVISGSSSFSCDSPSNCLYKRETVGLGETSQYE